jgi:hypothetical protein
MSNSQLLYRFTVIRGVIVAVVWSLLVAVVAVMFIRGDSPDGACAQAYRIADGRGVAVERVDPWCEGVPR